MLDRDWLAETEEDPIEPELEIVDAHHHLWPTAHRYGPYALEDLHADTGGGHRGTRTVFIDCGAEYLTDGPEHLRPVGETRYVAGRAARSDAGQGARIAAIVGHADLTLGDGVSDVLDAHIEAQAKQQGIAPRRLKERFAEPGLREQLRADRRAEKALDHLGSQARIEEVSGS